MTRNVARTVLALMLLATAAALTAAVASDAVHTTAPASSDILALLPAGEDKRSFILDCTGCHQLDAARAFASGRVRTRAEWQVAIERMLQMAGPASSFPVISARTDAAALAGWLAAHITHVPTAAARSVDYAARMREYDYPYPADLPHDLKVAADGRIIITGMFTHRMLILDPESGAYEEIPIPVQGANPRALDIDADGAWWVLLGGPRRVARHDPRTGRWDDYDVGMYGHSIGIDDRGRVWFNGHFTSNPAKLGYVDPTNGEVRTWDVPTPAPLQTGAGPIPYELRVAPDGAVWMSELQGNRVIRLDPRSGKLNAWSLPTSLGGPRRFDVDADGILWIPAYSGDLLVRFDPATEEFREIHLPVSNSLPYVVRADRIRGTIWVAAGAGDAVFSFDPVTGQFKTYSTPTRGALIRHIDIDVRTGDVWAAYGAAPGIPARILRITPAP
jgi:streptogramin lyase